MTACPQNSEGPTMTIYGETVWEWLLMGAFFVFVLGTAASWRIKRVTIDENTVALHSRDGLFVGIKKPGRYWKTARDRFDYDGTIHPICRDEDLRATILRHRARIGDAAQTG